jgi:uncharacterized membrane protein YeaQ/YmgE (transglycosylase-associated protein family)
MGIWALIALVGLVVGAGIYFAAPGKIRGGIVLTMLVGVIAALAMTWLGAQVGIATQGTAIQFFVAMVGTGLVLAVWRVAMGPA